eukprot:863715-Rhodomonas_salina.1
MIAPLPHIGRYARAVPHSAGRSQGGGPDCPADARGGGRGVQEGGEGGGEGGEGGGEGWME